MTRDGYVVARIIGALGNQMLQYATGRALAKLMGASLFIDTSAYRTYHVHRYSLDGFNIELTPRPSIVSQTGDLLPS